MMENEKIVQADIKSGLALTEANQNKCERTHTSKIMTRNEPSFVFKPGRFRNRMLPIANYGEIGPFRLSDKESYKECRMYARLAIGAFNKRFKESKRPLKLVDVIMANFVHGARPLKFLTFHAKRLHKSGFIDKSDFKTYQVIVHDELNRSEKFTVIAFRPKPHFPIPGNVVLGPNECRCRSSRKQWYWDDR